MKMKLQCYWYIMVLNIPAVVSDDMGLSKLKHHVRPMHPGTQKNNKHLANLILPQLILSMTTQLAWYFAVLIAEASSIDAPHQIFFLN
jgi:hypothetical protein